MVIKRDHYLEKLIVKKDNGQVKVITGLRRTGKTYLLKHLYRKWLVSHGVPKENVIFLELDQNKNSRYRNPLILLHIRDGFPKIVLVDQDIPTYRSEEGILMVSLQEFLLNEDVIGR